MQTHRFIATTLAATLLLTGAMFSGCSKTAPVPTASASAASPETVQRQQQTQQYIIQQREQARKRSRTHTAH